MMKDIKERFKSIRNDAKLSQKEFGNLINLSQSQIASYESGHRTITPRTVDDICLKFKVNKEWLLHGIGEPYLEKNIDTLISDALAEITLTNNEKLKEAVIKLCELDEPYLDLVLNLINGLNENKK